MNIIAKKGGTMGRYCDRYSYIGLIGQLSQMPQILFSQRTGTLSLRCQLMN